VKKTKIKLKVVSIDDDRGHVACCEGDVPEPVQKAIKKFLK
jgi:hypothetical protein